MNRHLKAVAGGFLIASLALSQCFAATATTPIHLAIKPTVIYVPSHHSTKTPDTTDYTNFSVTEKENYAKLSDTGKETVISVKAVTRTIASANSTLRNGKAVVVSWKNLEGGSISWTGTEIFRAKSESSFNYDTPFYAVKGKTWYKNNKDLSYGKKYYYQVRSYIIVEGYRFYSQLSPVTGVFVQKAAGYTKKEAAAFKSLTKVQRSLVEKIKETTVKLTATASGKKALLIWDDFASYRANDPGIKWTGAVIYSSKTKNGSYKKVATVKNADTASLKKALGQKYYKVQLYKVINGKAYYAPMSEPAKLTKR